MEPSWTSSPQGCVPVTVPGVGHRGVHAKWLALHERLHDAMQPHAGSWGAAQAGCISLLHIDAGPPSVAEAESESSSAPVCLCGCTGAAPVLHHESVQYGRSRAGWAVGAHCWRCDQPRQAPVLGQAGHALPPGAAEGAVFNFVGEERCFMQQEGVWITPQQGLAE